MPDIFINYRTGDEETSASLIEQELSRRFGSKKVFRASKSISPGENYPRELLAAVRSSKALLAIIGSRWLTAVDKQGRKRLDDEDDWTRREILEAFEHGVRVIPVLVGGAQRLRPSDLPPALAGRLDECHSVKLDYHNSADALRRLGDELAELIPSLVDSNYPQRAAGHTSDEGAPSARLRAGDHARQQVGTTNTMVHGNVDNLSSGSGHQFIGDGTIHVEGGNRGGIRQKFGSTPKRPDDQ
ncbi:MAG: toll/interleukin-1 receptor domain-containing protein [Pseudonocardiales bacterium]|nr:toll/interleukin-1 receptor domain-containing protein [Pseudonocardiales bacterium]